MIQTVIKILNVAVFRGAGSALSVFLSILVARYFRPEQASRFFLLLSIITILSVCFRWGLDEVIIRRTAIAASKNPYKVVGEMVRLGHLRVLKMLLALFIAVPFLLYIDRYMGIYKLTGLEVACIVTSSVFIALSAGVARIMQGLGKTNLASFYLNIITPLVACVWVFASSRLGMDLSVISIALVYVFTAMFSYILVIIWGQRSHGVSRQIFQATLSSTDRQDLSAANRLGLVVLAQQALNWGVLLLIPAMFDASTYSNFVVTQKISMIISFVMLTVNFTLSSRFAVLYASNDMHSLRRLILISSLAILVVSIAMAAVIILLQDRILKFSRIEGADAVDLLLILVVAQIFNAIAALYAVILSMTKNEHYLMISQVAFNFIGLILFALLAAKYGVKVASFSFAVTYLGLALILYKKIRQIVGVRSAT